MVRDVIQARGAISWDLAYQRDTKLHPGVGGKRRVMMALGPFPRGAGVRGGTERVDR